MSKTKKVINELLVEIFNHILAIEEEELKKSGLNLSMNEVHTLEAIANSDEPTMSNIAKKMRITTGTLTTNINRLVNKKYVTRHVDPNDRRRVFLELTDSSREVLKQHDKFHDEMIESLFQDLPIEEDEVLMKSLENIANYFKEKY
ncbi:MAG TPA: MarR family transcriptional regulator [Acholeplasmataceae bacterium]|nr:MarR family transcriptional regulator [Acholeplasmataceae bacterium]